MPKLRFLLLVSMPFLNVLDFPNLSLQILANLVIGDGFRNPPDEDLSLCEGLFDGDTLFVDYEGFQLADLINFLGRHLQECLILAVLLA